MWIAPLGEVVVCTNTYKHTTPTNNAHTTATTTASMFYGHCTDNAYWVLTVCGLLVGSYCELIIYGSLIRMTYCGDGYYGVLILCHKPLLTTTHYCTMMCTTTVCYDYGEYYYALLDYLRCYSTPVSPLDSRSTAVFHWTAWTHVCRQ